MIENLCKTKGVVWAYECIVGNQMHNVDEEENVFFNIFHTSSEVSHFILAHQQL
jgi:hypothetical protein